MGGVSRIEDERAYVSQGGGRQAEAQCIEKAEDLALIGLRQIEGYHASVSPPLKQPFRQTVLRVGGEARVQNPAYSGMGLQPAGHR